MGRDPFDDADELDVTPQEIARTSRTANIEMLESEMALFINQHGQQTPIIVVARCRLDGIEYAALFDVKTRKAYAVEVVRHNGEIVEFRDLDGPGTDEEWAVISNYFLDQKVFDLNQINLWYRTALLRERLSCGQTPIPKLMMKRWEERAARRRG